MEFFKKIIRPKAQILAQNNNEESKNVQEPYIFATRLCPKEGRSCLLFLCPQRSKVMVDYLVKTKDFSFQKQRLALQNSALTVTSFISNDQSKKLLVAKVGEFSNQDNWQIQFDSHDSAKRWKKILTKVVKQSVESGSQKVSIKMKVSSYVKGFFDKGNKMISKLIHGQKKEDKFCQVEHAAADAEQKKPSQLFKNNMKSKIYSQNQDLSKPMQEVQSKNECNMANKNRIEMAKIYAQQTLKWLWQQRTKDIKAVYKIIMKQITRIKATEDLSLFDLLVLQIEKCRTGVLDDFSRMYLEQYLSLNPAIAKIFQVLKKTLKNVQQNEKVVKFCCRCCQNLQKNGLNESKLFQNPIKLIKDRQKCHQFNHIQLDDISRIDKLQQQCDESYSELKDSGKKYLNEVKKKDMLGQIQNSSIRLQFSLHQWVSQRFHSNIQPPHMPIQQSQGSQTHLSSSYSSSSHSQFNFFHEDQGRIYLNDTIYKQYAQ